MARELISGAKIPVALLLLENYDIDTNVLRVANSIVEYDILVWNDQNEIVFEKSGKVGRKNLEKALSFEARYGVTHYINLELSVTLNGHTTKFITLSPDSTLIERLSQQFYIYTDFRPLLEKGGVSEAPPIAEGAIDIPIDITTTIDPTIAIVEGNEPKGMDSTTNWQELMEHIQEEWNAGGHLDIPIIVIEEEAGVKYILDTDGAQSVDNKTLENLSLLDLDFKRLTARTKLLKKEAVGPTTILPQEMDLIDNINSEDLYSTLMNLVKYYENSGIDNLSEYRQGMYKHLRQALDSLIVIKGKLENFNLIKKAK